MSSGHKWIILRNEGEDAAKNNLDSFKAFLLLLKFHCMEKMEIYRTLIKLLHVYNPRDGYEAYITLIQVICVLLVGIDSNMLNYLLSIIPLPQPCDQYKRIFIQEEVKRISGMSLLSIPAFHCIYSPISFDNVSESKSSNISLYLSDETSFGKTNFLGNGNVNIEEPTLNEYRLIQLTGNASDIFLNEVVANHDEKNINFSNESSNESFDHLVDAEPIKINEESGPSSLTESSAVLSVENMPKFDLNPNSALKESIQKFIAMVYGSSSIEGNGALDETSKTPENNILSSGVNKLDTVVNSVKHSQLLCSNDCSSSITKNDSVDDDTDIEILEVEENSTIYVQDNGQNDNHSKLKQESKRGSVQTDLKVTDQDEAFNVDASINLRHTIRDTKASNQQLHMSCILSTFQPFSYSSTSLIKEGNEQKLNQNQQSKDPFTANNVQSHGNSDHNTLQVSKNSIKAEALGLASINKSELIEYSFPSYNSFSDHEWNKSNAKLLDVGLKQNEEVHLNKQDIQIENAANTPTTIIPSIPVAHGFKRYRSYTSSEHLAYLHELALTKVSELKVPSDVGGCITSSTSETTFTQNEATRNCSKNEACQGKETAAIVTDSIAPEDTHYKNDCQNSSSENWITQGLRNNSLSGCHRMGTQSIPVNTANEENTNICTEYNISKMRSYAVHSLPKSDSLPIPQLPPATLLPPPPPPPQLPQSTSSSLSRTSSFSIAHSLSPKHVNTTDGQEWIMKLSENRRPLESLWPAYRPVYQPYTVYDSRFMQQRMQLSQRPVVIAQHQSSMNLCLEQSRGCVNQHGGRFWGVYSPIAHRIFPRQNSQGGQQQRISTANSDVTPRFIHHPSQRISTNRPIYISQLSKTSPDVLPQYTSHLAESKCKSLEEIVGRIKENNKQ